MWSFGRREASLRQIVAAMRRDLRRMGGGRIIVHREGCEADPCHCRPRKWWVR